jgi:two-component system, OmpR family, sensor kinase
MTNAMPDMGSAPRQHLLLQTLERLLAIQAIDKRMMLNEVSMLVNETLGADKSEVFIYDPTIDTLVSSGISDTPMSRQQIALGLDRLAVSNGGKTVQVFKTGVSFLTGHLDQEPNELPGMTRGLGVRSALVVPLDVNATRRGTVQVDSAQPDRFTADDIPFLEAVSRWVGMMLHRTELTEQIAQAAAERARHGAADELITTLAHDLRAPLVALKGRALMLQARAEREQHETNLRDARGLVTAANRLESMITDLMDTARLEQGIFDLSTAIVNLADIVRDTVAALTTEHDRIDVRGPDEVPVEGDDARLRQVVENLLSNALRYAPQGAPVTLEMRTETRDDGPWAVVDVRDSGPGIDPDVLPRLFTRHGTSRGTTGLGLGLYLARGIAEAHGGTLTLESPPGQGAMFRLALPLATI